jgi:hypothetical protein
MTDNPKLADFQSNFAAEISMRSDLAPTAILQSIVASDRPGILGAGCTPSRPGCTPSRQSHYKA